MVDHGFPVFPRHVAAVVSILVAMLLNTGMHRQAAPKPILRTIWQRNGGAPIAFVHTCFFCACEPILDVVECDLLPAPADLRREKRAKLILGGHLFHFPAIGTPFRVTPTTVRLWARPWL
jgi:hypothetical protein